MSKFDIIASGKTITLDIEDFELVPMRLRLLKDFITHKEIEPVYEKKYHGKIVLDWLAFRVAMYQPYFNPDVAPQDCEVILQPTSNNPIRCCGQIQKAHQSNHLAMVEGKVWLPLIPSENEIKERNIALRLFYKRIESVYADLVPGHVATCSVDISNLEASEPVPKHLQPIVDAALVAEGHRPEGPVPDPVTRLTRWCNERGFKIRNNSPMEKTVTVMFWR